MGRSFGFCPLLCRGIKIVTRCNFLRCGVAGSAARGIVIRMKRTGLQFVLASMVALLFLSSGGLVPEMKAETQGTFRGEVVAAPRGERSAGLLYLRGRDGNVRRIVVVRAAIVYDPTVAAAQGQKSVKKTLTPGMEVRVTALVDAKSGEWTASRVEVIAEHVSDSEDIDSEDGTAPDEVDSPRKGSGELRTI